MIDLEPVIRGLWPKAVNVIVNEWHCVETDERGFRALANTQLPARRDELRKWLHSYSVLRRLTSAQCDEVTEAVLVWTDANSHLDLMTVEALAAAHAELEAACQICVPCNADGKRRDFTSLASKALWLRFPNRVPIYDSYARNALQTISKMQRGFTAISNNRPEYEQFVHIWKQFYERYRETVENLSIKPYTHRARVFDVVLWHLGQPSYCLGGASPPAKS
jgi:hypothetical protein